MTQTRNELKNNNKVVKTALKDRTLLIDGNYLLKSSFEANINLTTKNFGPIGGLFTFMLTLRRLITQMAITKCVVFFDSEKSGFTRYQIDSRYKSNRPNKSWYVPRSMTEKQIEALERNKFNKPSMLKQKIRIQNYLENLYVRQVELNDGSEADDGIAQYCLNYNDDEIIYIYTNDRDMCQLIELDNVSVYLANEKVILGKENYQLYLDHHHLNMRIVKTICGCSSDYIRGVKNMGEKTLLNNFPRLKTEAVTLDEIINEAKIILEERKDNKKKPLAAIENLIKGIDSDDQELGKVLLENNYKMVDLMNPLINRTALHELKELCELPLDVEDRNSSNIINMMKDDGFNTVWNGSITDFFKPFYPVIIREKEFSKNNL